MPSEVPTRFARPNTADATLVASTLQTAEPHFFTTALGSRTGQVLREVVSQPGHAWSLDRARIAEVDGVAVGALIGGPADRRQPDLLQNLPWGWTRLRATAVALTWMPVDAFMRRHDEGEWYVNALAVGTAARGKGVGRALLQDAASNARELRMSSMALHVDAQNTTAINLYRSEGFVVIDSWTPIRLTRRPLVHRMQMILR